ncbi:MAG TPA: TonB-dependent siderophore receptor [Geminicoccus sp.]|uniref:TonB-dependent siderophore receptor n=1 Tax=Geminicoccus sp. TaxID=2024832 RepID=UPI002C929B0D|nr:TonB-dependent siderophore receptor [Geminicoccus sp.]HWL69158.1 TonB-dependent siderophore receptor [Geminicoccus sp.]
MALVQAGALAAQEGAADAAQMQSVYPFDIIAKPLPQAIADFSGVTGLQVLYTERSVFDHQAPALKGSFTASQALERLLAGTGLLWRFTSADTVTLEKPVTNDDEVQLGPVLVTGSMNPGTTEGTGSFTTDSVSTSTGLNLSLRETPQATTVTTRQQIQDQQLNSVQDVLNQTVGLSVSQTGAIGSDNNAVYARGFAISNYQTDGLPRSTVYGMDDSIADTALYDRVEVVRGATGLLNGVGDPSATVNLIRKRPTFNFAGYGQVSGGSWNTYRAEGDVSGPLNGSGTVRGRLVGVLQDGDSYVSRLTTEKQILYGMVEADLTPNTLASVAVEYQNHHADDASRAGFPLFFSDGGLANLSRSTNSSADWTYHENSNLSILTSLEHRFENDWTVKFDYEHSDRKYDTMIGYGIRGSLNRDGTGMSIWPGRWAADPVQDTFALTASGPYQLFGRQHEAMVGATAYWADGGGDTFPLWFLDGYDPTIDNYFTWDGRIANPNIQANGTFTKDERQIAGYAATRLRPTDDLAVILGARVTDWRYKETNTPDGGATELVDNRQENGVVTPYAGVVYDLTQNFSLYASYTSIFKPQSEQDVTGRTLDPLEGNGYEGGVTASFLDGALNGRFAMFEIQQDNLAVADGDNLAPDGSQAYRAVDGTTSKGFELELFGEVLPGWQVGGGYAQARPKDADGNELNTEIPEKTFKLFSTYQFPGIWDGLTVGAGVRWQSSMLAQDAGPNGEDFKQDDLAIVDLMARYRFTENFSLMANINNLFDKEYYTSIGANGFYGAPLNFLLTARAEW